MRQALQALSALRADWIEIYGRDPLWQFILVAFSIGALIAVAGLLLLVALVG